MPPVGSNQNNNNNNFNQNQNSNQGGPMPPVANNAQDDGKTLSIIGLVMAFLGMQLIGLILSIIGLSKAKKAGASKGVAIAGIVLNAIGMIVGLIIAIFLIIGIANNDSKSDTSNSSTSTSQSSDNSDISAVTADKVYDMDKICNNNYYISNAGTYTKGSSKVAVFYNSTDSPDNYTELYPSKSSWDAEFPSEVGLVACMIASEGASAGKSCDYTSSGEKVSIPLYKTNYEVKIIEALTGKVVATEKLTTNTGECPSYVSYDKSDPKVFEDPADDSVEGILTPYAG